MIKKTYLLVNYTMLFVLTIMIALFVLLARPQTTEYLASKYLRDFGVDYSKIEGSLLTGVTLYDVQYTDAVYIKKLHLGYLLVKLLRPTPELKLIKAEGLTLIPANFAKTQESNSSFEMFAFKLTQLQLSDLQIILDKEAFKCEVNASRVHYDKALDVKKLVLLLSSSYAKINAEGSIVSNRLKAKTLLTPTTATTEAYLGFLQGVPQTIETELELSLQRVLMRVHFDQLRLSAEENLSLNDLNITLAYRMEDEYFSLESRSSLLYGAFYARLKQAGQVSFSGDYSSEVNATLMQSPLELPFKLLQAKFSGNSEGVTGSVQAGELKLDLHGADYGHLRMHAYSKGLALSFLSSLPKALKDNVVTFSSDANLQASPFSLKGSFVSEGALCKTEGSFEVDQQNVLALANVHLKPEAELWKPYRTEWFFPLRIVFYDDKQSSMLNLDANLTNLTLFKKEDRLQGWGLVDGAGLDISGYIGEEEAAELKISALVPSLYTLLSDFGLSGPDDKLFVDAEVHIKTTLTLDEQIQLKSRIDLPWYLLKTDKKMSFTGKKLFIESTLTDKVLTIDRYSVDVMNQRVYSKKPSSIVLDSNGSIEFKKFWIYDNLLLSGQLEPASMQGKLHLYSERFKYESAEGNVTLKTDLSLSLDANGSQNVEGTITLLDGLISYAPVSDYSITDDDIIIIQDIEPIQKVNKRSVNIHINAAKAIRYKVKDIDILFSPDITLWQEVNAPLEILGMVTFEQGELSGGGKSFELDKSEVYFYGAHPINPYLNLNIHYKTIDYIDIEIFVTNTLDAPVLILASTPSMSQNDILSYILFGEAATSVFDTSGEGTSTAAVSSLLLGTGLKQIFNDTTGIKVDTLNILTNKEGTLGYEIGTRFSKDIRVLYKNDTTSSVILQYSLSRSIRIDVDVHETGQGVSILYVKDFK